MTLGEGRPYKTSQKMLRSHVLQVHGPGNRKTGILEYAHAQEQSPAAAWWCNLSA